MIVFPKNVVTDFGRQKEPAATLGVAVGDYLRDAIVDGSLEPGAPLKETELVTRLKFSSTPIRDALNRLAQLGLVQILSNRAKYVSPLESGVALDILEVRSVLLARACHSLRSAMDRDKMYQIRFQLDRMSSLARFNENIGILSAGFHIDRLLVEASGSAETLRVLNSREHYISRQLMLGSPHWIADEPSRWRGIVEALEAGNHALLANMHNQRMVEMIHRIGTDT